MNAQAKTLKQRRAALTWYLARQIPKGFRIVSITSTTAELFRPERFPAFLRKDKSCYVDVDEQGRIWVLKSNY